MRPRKVILLMSNAEALLEEWRYLLTINGYKALSVPISPQPALADLARPWDAVLIVLGPGGDPAPEKRWRWLFETLVRLAGRQITAHTRVIVRAEQPWDSGLTAVAPWAGEAGVFFARPANHPHDIMLCVLKAATSYKRGPRMSPETVATVQSLQLLMDQTRPRAASA